MTEKQTERVQTCLKRAEMKQKLSNMRKRTKSLLKKHNWRKYFDLSPAQFGNKLKSTSSSTSTNTTYVSRNEPILIDELRPTTIFTDSSFGSNSITCIVHNQKENMQFSKQNLFKPHNRSSSCSSLESSSSLILADNELYACNAKCKQFIDGTKTQSSNSIFFLIDFLHFDDLLLIDRISAIFTIFIMSSHDGGTLWKKKHIVKVNRSDKWSYLKRKKKRRINPVIYFICWAISNSTK
jgi:hypothetical protein